ncbi:MAG: 1-acyl-sn-glycerol-3-phosphate acyltransferase [Myxococcales bacterium]|nr:1-acyl-sn-glycerol-3-phosphate acyltransferase [Myxococcales bacterium]
MSPAAGLVHRLAARAFERMTVDEAWERRVREADARGTVVYVQRNVSVVDYFALEHLTRKLGLPPVRFANDRGLSVLDPGRGPMWQKLLPRDEAWYAAELARVLEEGASAALFLKRPPSLLEPATGNAVLHPRGSLAARPSRGRAEGDVYLHTVLAAQRARATPILLVPQVFVWSKHPDSSERGVVDALFGPREWPGTLRTLAQFLLNFRHVTLRAGEPLDVGQFLAQQGPDAPDDVLVRRLTYALLRRLERERRAVVGPSKKPLDRVRAEVARSPKLKRTIVELGGEGLRERRALQARALALVEELESAQDMNAIQVMDAAFDATLAKMYSAIEVDQPGLARLKEASKDGTLILLPSHKSHVDYIILTRIFYHARMPAPVIAAGDNLNFFPLGDVLRRGGAFFIRRSFKGDRLYGAVVDAYIRRLILDGVSLEVFLEGGRSRTGKLLSPKLGLLSMVVEAALGGHRRVYFCPISIGYERVVEERSLVRELTGGEKSKEDVRGLLRALETLVGRYGRLNVQFGEPLTLEGVQDELQHPREATAARPPASPAERARAELALTPARRRALITRLAHRVMNEINRVTAVTPGALVATALLSHGRRGISDADLLALCVRLFELLRRFGARFSPSVSVDGRTVRRAGLAEATELFFRAGHLEVRLPGEPLGKEREGAPGPSPDAFYLVRDERRHALDLAKNVVVHFFVDRGLVATALLAQDGPPTTRETLATRVQALSRLFKHEFSFRVDAPFERIFEETLDAMLRDGELRDDARGGVTVGDGAAGDDARLYAGILLEFVEGYRIAARALGALAKGPLPAKDLAKRALAVGDRMFLGGEIQRKEAVSRALFDNAFTAFVEQGYLAREDGKLRLAESFATPGALGAVEGKVLGFLPDARRRARESE